MPDYGFYTSQYYGAVIPEKVFSGMIQRAARALEHFRTIYRVAPCGVTEEAFALCAMAETIYRYEQRGLLRSTRAGSVSASYGEEKPLSAALYESAAVYLDIYRGVEE